MFKLFVLKRQVLELRGLLEREQLNNIKLNKRINNLIQEKVKLFVDISDLEEKNKKLLSKNENYLPDLIKYEKEIKELEERNKFLMEENQRNWKIIRQIKDEDKKVIKDYLIKKYNLLADQKAPTPLLELIDNLIQEINS